MKALGLAPSNSKENHMINGMTLMLYVKNVQRAVNFWTALGFENLLTIPLEDGAESVVLTSTGFGNVSIQLYEQAYIRKTNPELEIVTPPLLFSTDEIDEAYEQVQKETKRVSEIVPMGDDYTFSFYDLDGNQFSVRGARIDKGLTPDIIELYFENLKHAQLVNARDIEFLPDNSLLFFGRVTDEGSRELAGKLSTINKGLYYVDTESRALSPDLQIICRRYEVEEEPALIRRLSNGKFDTYNPESSLSQFLR